MKKSVLFVSLLALAAAVSGCVTNPSRPIPATTTVLPYKAPDIAELTGIDPDAGPDEEPVEPGEVEDAPKEAPKAAPTPVVKGK